ncbi:HpcH/HpaI aldolase/citrate lyase family protein [Bordetella sp. BOR01]|uniref:HpcH/HpaI aldolase family protein n=1 Tax=Bordetella sp. BOR01 TaxID=2854779 RepID=UPI001C477F6F|nr:aldolase/citrate lyase family protein [Bordetella sp. BOR01]MBV7481821.1 hypothetical protein [Bordetella sp. BOR01]
MAQLNEVHGLRARVRRGDSLVGVFARLVQPEAAELLADAGLDFVILDVEHGTHSRTELSRYVFAAQALGLPVLVRLPEGSEAWIQHAVSVGAAGIVVPHVNALEQVGRAAAFARGLAMERAYAGMGRRSGYRKDSWRDFRRQASDGLLFVAQIDEPPGTLIADKVAALDDVDCLFLGSLGMALAMGQDAPSHPTVDAALASICQSGRSAGKCIGVHVMQHDQQALWLDRGATLMVVGSDYALLRDGAATQATRFRRAKDTRDGD